jgi:dihydrofolate reductase
MTSVICDMSMSLDGYVTGPNDSREHPFGDGATVLHHWIFDRATDDDRAVMQDLRDGVGAVVMGRTSFDKNEGDGGWDEGGPLGDTPCFVVTHHPPQRSHPSVFTFVTDGVAAAIGQAKQTAGDKQVSLFGATVMQQALPLGLVDEIRVHVVPVLLGGGTSLFGGLDSAITLERIQAVCDPGRHPPRVPRDALGGSDDRALERRARDRCATLNHQPDPVAIAEQRGVGERVAVDHREVGELPDLDRSDVGVDPKCLSRALSGG